MNTKSHITHRYTHSYPSHYKKSLRDLLARHGEAAAAIDLSSHIQPPPVTAPPGLPLPTVYQLMRGHGVEFLPVVARYGPLEGAVTRCVRVFFVVCFVAQRFCT